MKITKEEFIERGFQLVIILYIFIIMFLGGWIFLLASLIFFVLAAAFEGVIINRFVSKNKAKISKKDKISKKVKDGFLWVHGIIYFIKKYNTTIYHHEKIGNLTGIISYFVVFLYVGIAYLLFQVVSYYAFIIYLIPIVTNIVFYFQNHYYIFNYSKKR